MTVQRPDSPVSVGLPRQPRPAEAVLQRPSRSRPVRSSSTAAPPKPREAAPLALPTPALAELVAEEWRGQGDVHRLRPDAGDPSGAHGDRRYRRHPSRSTDRQRRALRRLRPAVLFRRGAREPRRAAGGDLAAAYRLGAREPAASTFETDRRHRPPHPAAGDPRPGRRRSSKSPTTSPSLAWAYAAALFGSAILALARCATAASTPARPSPPPGSTTCSRRSAGAWMSKRWGERRRSSPTPSCWTTWFRGPRVTHTTHRHLGRREHSDRRAGTQCAFSGEAGLGPASPLRCASLRAG